MRFFASRYLIAVVTFFFAFLIAGRDEILLRFRAARRRRLLLALLSGAADGRDVELVIFPLLAVQDPARPQLGVPVPFRYDLKRRLSMVLVHYPEAANRRSDRPDRRRYLDERFVLLDKSVVAVLQAVYVEPRYWKNRIPSEINLSGIKNYKSTEIVSVCFP